MEELELFVPIWVSELQKCRTEPRKQVAEEYIHHFCYLEEKFLKTHRRHAGNVRGVVSTDGRGAHGGANYVCNPQGEQAHGCL